MVGNLRPLLDGLKPEGAILNPAPGGDLDALFDAMGDNWESVRAELEKLAYLRNPASTPILDDLEREFGISFDSGLTEQTRRENLANIRYRRRTIATAAKLQRALDRSGFGNGGYGLIVIPNASPATDPAAIVDKSYQLTAHAIGDGSPAVAGNLEAYAAQRGGYYLVNGDTYQSSPVYPQAGQICARAFDGSDSKSGTESAGYYASYALYSNEFTAPPETHWSLVFFVGGIISRNPSGSIASVGTVEVPMERRQELHRLVLRIKPLGIWAAMIVRFV